MTARARDAIGIAIFLVAAVAVRFAWHPLGPWVALGIAFGSVLAVVAVYRASPRRPASHESEAADQPVLLHQD
jgi:hypothetical protein